jgi:hypothetical protein
MILDQCLHQIQFSLYETKHSEPFNQSNQVASTSFRGRLSFENTSNGLDLLGGGGSCGGGGEGHVSWWRRRRRREI